VLLSFCGVDSHGLCCVCLIYLSHKFALLGFCVLGSFYLNSGGMKVLSNDGYRSLIDLNQTFKLSITIKDLISLMVCAFIKGKTSTRYVFLNHSLLKFRSELFCFSIKIHRSTVVFMTVELAATIERVSFIVCLIYCYKRFACSAVI
jgi:hypothetical protein